MARSIGAVLAGLVVTVAAVIVGTLILVAAWGNLDPDPTPGYLVANLAISALAAGLGGLVVVRIARGHPWRHAAALGALLVLLALPGLSPAPGQPALYPIGVLLLGLVGVGVGSMVAVRRGWGR